MCRYSPCANTHRRELISAFNLVFLQTPAPFIQPATTLTAQLALIFFQPLINFLLRFEWPCANFQLADYFSSKFVRGVFFWVAAHARLDILSSLLWTNSCRVMKINQEKFRHGYLLEKNSVSERAQVVSSA